MCPFEVVVEGDSLMVTEALKSDVPNLSKVGHLLDLAKHMGRCFREIFFNHISGEGNDVVNVLIMLRLYVTILSGWRWLLFLQCSL